MDGISIQQDSTDLEELGTKGGRNHHGVGTQRLSEYGLDLSIEKELRGEWRVSDIREGKWSHHTISKKKTTRKGRD